ncbi:hypothetical protein [Sphingosinicella terrae]|uniref:hypothetical protein n=1 Tax=Sphingosinicella terrae TaxID=2172047 RepID=UPI000E0D3750|nr:hypothetical protein [Sphingosinicella terrae]
MHLVEILLPLRDNEGRTFGRELFAQVREEMVERYGGVTAFTRAPAEGIWQADEGRSRDEIVLVEVMTDVLDRHWWGDYRAELEQRFEQEQIVMRSHEVETL